MNNADTPPSNGRRFYSIVENEDGSVDVYLAPLVRKYDIGTGIAEFDISVTVVRGVIPWDGLEEDIRRRYDDWRASGERIDL